MRLRANRFSEMSRCDSSGGRAARGVGWQRRGRAPGRAAAPPLGQLNGCDNTTLPNTH